MMRADLESNKQAKIIQGQSKQGRSTKSQSKNEKTKQSQTKKTEIPKNRQIQINGMSLGQQAEEARTGGRKNGAGTEKDQTN